MKDCWTCKHDRTLCLAAKHSAADRWLKDTEQYPELHGCPVVGPVVGPEQTQTEDCPGWEE